MVIFLIILFLCWLLIQLIEIQINGTINGDEKSIIGLLNIPGTREPTPLVLITIIPKIKRTKIRLFTMSFRIEFNRMMKLKKPWKMFKGTDIVSLISKMNLKEFKFNVIIGLGDCAHTAIACGFCYGVFGSIASVVANSFKGFQEISVVASPDYNKNRFDYELVCILQADFADIIYGFVKTFYKKLKGRCKKC